MGRLARSIALGQGFSSPTDLASGPSAWTAPLYPYILAGVFKVFGIYTAAAGLVILTFNSIFGALTCLTLFFVGRHMFGESVGRGAAWTWAVFPYAIYWPTRVVWETSFTTFLLSLALLMTLRIADDNPVWRSWIYFGLLWGIIILTNTAVVSMMPFCLLWIYYKRRESSVLAGAVVSVVIAVLMVMPWTIRNYEIFGKFIFVRDNLPLELAEANNDRSEGLWTRNEHPANDAEAMQQFKQLGELRFMDEKKAEVHEFIREHPLTFVEYCVERAIYFWIAPPQATIVGGYDLMISRHVNFGIAAAFAFAGLWLAWRRRIPGVFLLTCFMLIYPLPYYLVNPFVRYKHPIEPVMVLLIVFLFWESRKVQIHWPKRSV
jgi:4-amino-4-deoxy-L-arabinose transferase-like glycosyltransferase